MESDFIFVVTRMRSTFYYYHYYYIGTQPISLFRDRSRVFLLGLLTSQDFLNSSAATVG